MEKPGWLIRDEHGGENQVFYGSAKQLLEEHGPTAKFLRHEVTGEPYEGKQPADVAKERKGAANDESPNRLTAAQRRRQRRAEAKAEKERAAAEAELAERQAATDASAGSTENATHEPTDEG